MLSQVTEPKFTKYHVKKFNKIILHLESDMWLGLSFPRLDINPLLTVAFTESPFANTEDLPTQIYFIVFLQDSSGLSNGLDFSSLKSRRLVRSVLGSEILAFADEVDTAILIRSDIQHILKKRIYLRILTNS